MAPRKLMHIFVKILAGRVITVVVEEDFPIKRVKSLICDQLGMKESEQRLFYDGNNSRQELKNDEYTLKYYKVEKESTLILVQKQVQKEENKMAIPMKFILPFLLSLVFIFIFIYSIKK